jgi:internalin A
LGIALNFRDDPRLRFAHVLNPQWVTNGVYRILNSDLVERNRGELSLSDLCQILDPEVYPPPMHDFLLSLMRRFELCFRFPEPRDQTFLIPELLGKEQPHLGSEFQPTACLNFQYTYPVWPEGLLPRFIVRTHALSANQFRWRTGVILDFDGNRALVKADPQERVVFISVTGPQQGRRRLLAVIRSDFERIHADISKLNPGASVPLPGDPSVAIPYEELRVYESSGIVSVPRVVGGVLVTVNVEELLNSVELPAVPAGEPVRIFVSYSHKDDDLRAELETHLKLFQRLGLAGVYLESGRDTGK